MYRKHGIKKQSDSHPKRMSQSPSAMICKWVNGKYVFGCDEADINAKATHEAAICRDIDENLTERCKIGESLTRLWLGGPAQQDQEGLVEIEVDVEPLVLKPWFGPKPRKPKPLPPVQVPMRSQRPQAEQSSSLRTQHLAASSSTASASSSPSNALRVNALMIAVATREMEGWKKIVDELTTLKMQQDNAEDGDASPTKRCRHWCFKSLQFSSQQRSNAADTDALRVCSFHLSNAATLPILML